MAVDEFWEGLWKREEEFLQTAEKKFRHDVSFVGVSTLASQYYCEYKVENEFKLGEVPTEAKETGTELHDELMPMVRITAEEFARLVSRKTPSYAVLNVWGTVEGLRLVGTPDHIVWSEGRPLWLMELKTTRGDPNPLWEDQENQVRIYGLLLDRMGFDCSRMRLAVVRLKISDLGENEKREWILRVSKALMEDRTRILEGSYQGLMKVHILEHDVGRAKKAVHLEAGYWLREREPVPSTSVGKCRACEYNSACPKSLFTPT
ncbi:MAG TPA: PD-(D/E)XK nuclease family protein [Nitrososphaerales archaeon]|nr:PD-(D/E)XK nuclease family protein [Nitrososphaerales archaeon]